MKFIGHLFFPLAIVSCIFFFFIGSALSQTYIPPIPWKLDTLIIVPSSSYFYKFPEKHRPYLETLQLENNQVQLREGLDYRVGQNKLKLYFFPF